MNIILWIGIALIALGIFLGAREHVWLSNAQVVPGKIIEMIATRGSKGRTNYTPRVQFTASDGTAHEFVRGYGSSPPEFSVGEKIMVAYERRTYDARILTFGQRFGFATVALGIGLGIAFVSLSFIMGRQLVPRIYLH